MNFAARSRALNDSIGYQVFIVGLSIYAVGALLLDLIVHFPPQVSRMIQHFDFLICFIFFFDFLIQFTQAQNKLSYMKVGWIDLLASVPSVDVLRWGRLARILRILRVLRAIRGTHRIYRMLFASRGNAVGSAAVAALLVVIFASISILLAETDPQSNIKTAEDAIWWSFTTISTVGYGDRFPVTVEGRTIAVLLMIAGIGLLGSVTALVASWFTGSAASQSQEGVNSTSQQIAILVTNMNELRESLARIETHLNERRSAVRAENNPVSEKTISTT